MKNTLEKIELQRKALDELKEKIDNFNIDPEVLYLTSKLNNEQIFAQLDIACNI